MNACDFARPWYKAHKARAAVLDKFNEQIVAIHRERDDELERINRDESDERAALLKAARTMRFEDLEALCEDIFNKAQAGFLRAKDKVPYEFNFREGDLVAVQYVPPSEGFSGRVGFYKRSEPEFPGAKGSMAQRHYIETLDGQEVRWVDVRLIKVFMKDLSE